LHGRLDHRSLSRARAAVASASSPTQAARTAPCVEIDAFRLDRTSLAMWSVLVDADSSRRHEGGRILRGSSELCRNREVAVFQYEADKTSDAVVAKLQPFRGTLTADAEDRFNAVYTTASSSWPVSCSERARLSARSACADVRGAPSATSSLTLVHRWASRLLARAVALLLRSPRHGIRGLR
jgi:hypothetical protein